MERSTDVQRGNAVDPPLSTTQVLEAARTACSAQETGIAVFEDRYAGSPAWQILFIALAARPIPLYGQSPLCDVGAQNLLPLKGSLSEDSFSV